MTLAQDARGQRAIVSRRALAWLFSLPLMLLGLETAHALAYRLVEPDPHARAALLAQSGHGYLAHLPAVLAAVLALAACALVAHVTAPPSAAGPATRLAAWPFAALPLLAFVLQEHLERIVQGGFPAGTALGPTFTLGLLLQLPFAAAAYLLARALLGAAERIATALRGQRPRLRLAAPGPGPAGLTIALPRPAALASGQAERGPPASF